MQFLGGGGGGGGGGGICPKCPILDPPLDYKNYTASPCYVEVPVGTLQVVAKWVKHQQHDNYFRGA